MKCYLCNEKQHDVMVKIEETIYPMCNECNVCFNKNIEKLKNEEVNYQMEEKVFTQSDIKEMQKSFNDTLKAIHSNLYNILLNTKENKSSVLNLISYVSDEMKIIEEDIKIETQPDKE